MMAIKNCAVFEKTSSLSASFLFFMHRAEWKFKLWT